MTSDGASEDRVGWGVAVGGAQIAVGADLDDHGTSTTSNEGSVYLYPRSSTEGERFETVAVQLAAAPAPANYFGCGARHGRHDADRRRGAATTSAPTTTRARRRSPSPPPRRPPARTAATTTATARPTSPTTPGASRPTTPARRIPRRRRRERTRRRGRPRRRAALPPGVKPDDVDDGSKAPRIIRPRTQPPVTPTKERVIKIATVWACMEVAQGRHPLQGLRLGRHRRTSRRTPRR